MNGDDWSRVKAFHGHECPGLAIGARVCDAAIEKLDLTRAEDEEVVCVTENDACGVDAIQVLLGCTVGKGNLILRLTGKQAFTFYDRQRGKAMRFYLKSRRGERTIDEYLDYLLSAPVDEIFYSKEATAKMPESARIFDPVKCDKCGEFAAEPMIRLSKGQKLCLDCYATERYTRGW